MKNIKIITVICSIGLFIACKKDVDIQLKESTCDADYSSHPKNESYQDVLHKYIGKGLPGLSVLVSTPEEGIWAGAAGYAKIEDKIEMTPCNLHHYGSIPKTYIAVIIFQLIEEGKLNFDSKISAFLDKQKYGYIANFNELTVRHLLQHTSGLPDIFDIEFISEFFNDPLKYYTSDDLLEFIRGKKALHKPGTKFKYSDANYTLLSFIIDEIDGDHIKSFSERIFIPLNLVNSFYHNNESYPYIDGLASSYWDEYSNGTIENVTDWQIHLTNMILASDGIIGNIFDLEIFIKSIFNGNLLSEAVIKQLETEWIDAKDSDMGSVIDFYGFGLMRMDNEYGKWVGHMGNHVGSAAFVFYNVEKDIAIVVATNMGTFFSLTYKGMIFYNLRNDLFDVIFKK